MNKNQYRSFVYIYTNAIKIHHVMFTWESELKYDPKMRMSQHAQLIESSCLLIFA